MGSQADPSQVAFLFEKFRDGSFLTEGQLLILRENANGSICLRKEIREEEERLFLLRHRFSRDRR